MIRVVEVLLSVIVVFLVTQGAFAQSGTRGGVRPQASTGPKAMTADEFQKKFWAYLTASRSAYRTEQKPRWKAFPESEKSTVGKFPHGSFVKIYTNRRTERNPLLPPDGAIIVQENYAADKSTLKSISVMYRAAGYNAQHGDWYWTQYLPDGSLARTSQQDGNLPIAGRTASCIKCHSKAKGGDLLFANDRLGQPSTDRKTEGPVAPSPGR
jgi:hypothetical protein